jgi:hypothetical protein
MNRITFRAVKVGVVVSAAAGIAALTSSGGHAIPLAEMRRVPADSGAPALLRDLELARASAFHLHVRVRPVLREIAAHRLRTRYGVELDREAARARELAGASVWEVVRPDRSPPVDRLALGPSTAELRTVADELEAI